MALVKRNKDAKPKINCAVGPSRTKWGHWIYIAHGENTWQCMTCDQKFSAISIADNHKCKNDPLAIKQDPKWFYHNGNLVTDPEEQEKIKIKEW